MPLIRRATPQDVESIEIIRAVSPQNPWTSHSIYDMIGRANHIVLVAQSQDHVVGYVFASVAADEGEILMLEVDAAARRQGIARQILMALIQTWAQCGVTQGYLEVHTDNTAARTLYAATGWHASGSRQGYYSDGADAIVMTIHIPQDLSG